MQYSIDEIYDLFMWDNQLSNEENEAKAQNGIAAAQKIKNLFPFMQPIVVPPTKSKLVWEPCARVIAARSDEELLPYMFMLLEWLQDLNWPGALIIYERLKKMPFTSIEFAYKHSRIKAEQTNDTCWLGCLEDLCEDMIDKQKA